MTTPLTKKDSRKEQSPRAQGSPASGDRSEQCDHQWTDYGILKSGDNPELEIEVCVRCGVQQKKPQHNEPRGQQQEWTPEYVRSLMLKSQLVDSTPFDVVICDAHNAALAAERGKSNDFKRYADSYIESLEHRLHIERQDHNDLRDTCKAQLELIAAEREKLAEHIKAANEVTDENIELEQQLAAERQRREQAEARPAPIAGNWIAHQSENPKYPEEWDVFEGGPRGYSVIGDGFITEDQAKEIASRHNLVEQQLLSALAEIEKKHSALYDLLKGRNKTSEANALKALDYTNLDALHEHDAKVREPLVEALEWAWAIIANAGGGDWQREAKDWQDAAAKWRDEAFHPALAKVKEQ